MIPLDPAITGLKPGGILVWPAAWADRIKQFDLVKLSSECVIVVAN